MKNIGKRSMRSNVLYAILILAIVSAFPASSLASSAKAWAGGKISSVDVKKTTTTSTTSEGDENTGDDVAPKTSPTGAIKDLDAMLDDFKTGTNLTAEEEEHNRKLKMKIIHGTFDMRELSKLSLAKHWLNLTDAQRDHFVDLMVSLLEEKALFSKEQSAAKSKKGGKYKVLYKGHKYLDKDRRKSFVRTKVIILAENIDIDLNYKLKRQAGEWKIYDVIVDEASLVSNYKYQFNSIITKHGYDELVSRMTKKLNEIKAERRANNS